MSHLVIQILKKYKSQSIQNYLRIRVFLGKYSIQSLLLPQTKKFTHYAHLCKQPYIPNQQEQERKVLFSLVKVIIRIVYLMSINFLLNSDGY